MSMVSQFIDHLAEVDANMQFKLSNIKEGDKLLHASSKASFTVVSKVMKGDDAVLTLDDGYCVMDKIISDNPLRSQLDNQWRHIAK